jgi:hypothetical protein
MRVKGCGLHARQQTLAMLDKQDRQGGGGDSEARKQHLAGL